MATAEIQPARVRRLNDADERDGRYVLYWMQQSQRAECNHALEYAIQRANDRGRPLVVGFGLTDDYPEANLRHYRFLLEGLRETAGALGRRGIPLVVRRGPPDEVALELAAEADLVVADRGYLRHQRAWRRRVADEAGRAVVEVEADVVVPIDVVSDKAEHAARTIRPKIEAALASFLVGLRTTALDRSADPGLDGLDLEDVDGILDRLDLDRSVQPVSWRFQGGTAQARSRLSRFVEAILPDYAESRGQPHLGAVSELGPYLHFGQISPVYVALAVRDAAGGSEAAGAFLEELVVRRELAVNFVHHTADYDRWAGLPEWARATLEAHADDERERRYTRAELEAAETHDRYWNAAMREMVATGYLHNHMRMYWGKRILAWTNTPSYAHRVALELNNKYFLDGRDPSSFANVGWLFGLHDRPWPERVVFGKVRSMTAGGLERKTDPDAYLARVDELVAEAERKGG